jgi:hypothetical protein
VRRIFQIALVVLAASLSFAQINPQPITTNQAGVPTSALVTICGTNPGTGTCGSLVTTYTNSANTTACTGTLTALNNTINPTVGAGCSNPGYSDAQGNVVAYAAAGQYFCQFSGATTSAYTRPCSVDGGTGGSGTPATPFNSVQFNNAGAFGGSSELTFIPSTENLFLDNLVAGLTTGPAMSIGTPLGLPGFPGGLMLTGNLADGFASELEIHNPYSAGERIFTHAGASAFRGATLNMEKSMGTQASPTAVTNTGGFECCALSYIGSFGYDGSVWNQSAYIGVFADENWSVGTPGHHGASFHFYATNVGGNAQEKFQIDGVDPNGIANSGNISYASLCFSGAGVADPCIVPTAGGPSTLALQEGNSGTSYVIFSAGAYATATNCSSSASPAVCGSAAAGSVALPTGATPTLQVNTTVVTANSQILLQIDESLGTKLGVTCNTTLSTLLNPVVTARSAGASFTFTINSTLLTNPACISYSIVN